MPFNLPDNGKLKPGFNLADMTDETEKENKRKEYLFRVKQAESDYIAELPKMEMIYQRNVFAGLLRTINIVCGIPDYNDEKLMNQLYDYYSIVCARYNQNVTVERFIIMIGLTKDYINSWYEGKSSPFWRYLLSKRLKTETESSMIDGAMTGNPGYIFLLKAKFDYNDTPQTQTNNDHNETVSLESLAMNLGVSIDTGSDEQRTISNPDPDPLSLPGEILD